MFGIKMVIISCIAATTLGSHRDPKDLKSKLSSGIRVKKFKTGCFAFGRSNLRMLKIEGDKISWKKDKKNSEYNPVKFMKIRWDGKITCTRTDNGNRILITGLKNGERYYSDLIFEVMESDPEVSAVKIYNYLHEIKNEKKRVRKREMRQKRRREKSNARYKAASNMLLWQAREEIRKFMKQYYQIRKNKDNGTGNVKTIKKALKTIKLVLLHWNIWVEKHLSKLSDEAKIRFLFRHEWRAPTLMFCRELLMWLKKESELEYARVRAGLYLAKYIDMADEETVQRYHPKPLGFRL